MILACPSTAPAPVLVFYGIAPSGGNLGLYQAAPAREKADSKRRCE